MMKQPPSLNSNTLTKIKRILDIQKLLRRYCEFRLTKYIYYVDLYRYRKGLDIGGSFASDKYIVFSNDDNFILKIKLKYDFENLEVIHMPTFSEHEMELVNMMIEYDV